MIIFAIFLSILLTPWQLHLKFRPKPKLYLGKWGLFLPLPSSERGQGREDLSWKKLPHYLRIYRESRAKLSSLSLNLQLGTGDAAATAQLVGTLWALAGVLRPLLPKKTSLSIEACYGPGACFQATGSCIFRLLPGYIIIIWIKNLVGVYGKGGDYGGRGSRRETSH